MFQRINRTPCSVLNTCKCPRSPVRIVTLVFLLLNLKLATGQVKAKLPLVVFEIIDEAKTGTVIGNLPQRLWPTSTTTFSLILITSSKFQRFNEYFSVSKNGTLTVEKPVDRDNVNEICGPLDCCHLLVCLLDTLVMFIVERSPSQALPTVSGLSNDRLMARLLIRVLDVNDNPPRFPLDVNDHVGFTINIQEGSKVAMETLPNAVDLDSLGNGIIEYRLATTNNDETADRAIFKLSYQKLAIPPSDGGNATGAKQLWHLSSPILVQLRDLDFEQPQDRQFKLIVMAIDGGYPAQTGTLSVTVNLIDINDNAPVFVRPNTTTMHLLENTTYSPDPIYKFQATDADSDENAQIVFSLSPLNDVRIFEKFSIDPQTGALFLTAPLDYEVYSERQFSVIAVAADGGSPRRSGTATLTIATKDINDNLPALIVQENVTVIEGVNYTKPVLRFYVKDEDSVSRNKVHCRAAPHSSNEAELITGAALLRLQEVTTNAYFVFTTGVFDYEETLRASLEIICVDNVSDATRQISETVIRITVAVGDANDHYPEFGISEFVTKIPEHATRNTLVANLTAKDADSGENAKIVYSLVKNTVSLTTAEGQRPHCDILQMLKVDSSTGIVTVQDGTCMDREIADEVSAFVVAEDGGGLSTSIKLRILLSDINDNPPVFEGSETFFIRENFPSSFTIGIIKFTDRDLGLNSVIHLQLSENNSRHVLDAFDLIPEKSARNSIPKSFAKKWQVSGKHELSALLISRNSFDRELTESYAVQLIATDMGNPQLHTLKTVHVTVLDENDNAPVPRFPQPGMLVGHHPKVHTNSPLGFEVCKLRASDPDKGENGSLIFELQKHSNGSKYFRLDRLSGRLTTAWNRLPGDTHAPKPGVHQLKVLVYDSGAQPVKVPWEFSVHISPINPNLEETILKQSQEHSDSSLLSIDVMTTSNSTMLEKLDQMTSVMIIFAVFILTALMVSCVCMVRFLVRGRSKPVSAQSLGSKDCVPSVYCPSALGMIYSRPNTAGLPVTCASEDFTSSHCTNSVKYRYAMQEHEPITSTDWHLQTYTPGEQCDALINTPDLQSDPLNSDYYLSMPYTTEFSSSAGCVGGNVSSVVGGAAIGYPTMWPQFSL